MLTRSKKPKVTGTSGTSITNEQIHLVRKAMLGVPRKNAYHRAILADCGPALDGDKTCRESVAYAYNKMLRSVWFGLVLDGTYSVAEMRAAIVADRDPVPQREIDAANKRLVDEVRSLPDYRGWRVMLDDRHDAMTVKLVWRHPDDDRHHSSRAIQIWVDLVHKNSDQIDVAVEVTDPNDDPCHARRAYETLTEHTAAAVFAMCKPLLDKYSDKYSYRDEP